MGTGNFNIALVKEQNPKMDFGVALLPGVKSGEVSSFAGGDIVTIPKGSKRVNDAIDFMKFLLSDETQVEVYAKNLNMTTRGDMADNKYFRENPNVQEVAKAIQVAKTPYTLKFFELINSPQGPWLQMLQRAYYEDTDLDTIIADAKAQMKAIAAE
jgi:multiple sugar transport system substrate-binding protein